MAIGEGILTVFGRNLDRLMSEKRVQNEDMGKAVGREKTAVSRWRNGKASPDTLEQVEKAAELLGVPAYLLLMPEYDTQSVLNVLKMARSGMVSGQPGLLAHLLQIVAASLSWTAIPKWSASDAAALEKLVASYHLEAHPLTGDAVPGEEPEAGTGRRGRNR